MHACTLHHLPWTNHYWLRTKKKVFTSIGKNLGIHVATEQCLYAPPPRISRRYCLSALVCPNDLCTLYCISLQLRPSLGPRRDPEPRNTGSKTQQTRLGQNICFYSSTSFGQDSYGFNSSESAVQPNRSLPPLLRTTPQYPVL